MTSQITKQKQAEQRLASALRLFNDAIRAAHEVGLDVDISELTMHTPRGPMLRVDLKTFPLKGAPPILRVVE